MNLCGLSQPGPDLPDAGEGTCCMGAAMFGPERCTCWQPVYDLDQAQPVEAAPSTRAAPCEDCAFRADSPERQGEPGYAGSEAELDRLVATGQPFFCHQGIRRPITWRHPTGTEIPGDPANYQPPIIVGVPYRADGTPAEVCAGWAARHRALKDGDSE